MNIVRSRSGSANNNIEDAELLDAQVQVVYTYLGLIREPVPKNVTEVIIAPSVHTIQGCAFIDCISLARVTIPDSVTRIEGCAFHGCVSLLKPIQFPRNLKFIGRLAFWGCISLDAVYLPPTVAHIGDQAFRDCTSLKFFFHVPQPIEYFGYKVIYGCTRLSITIKYYQDHNNNNNNNDQVNEWLMQRHANFPFHRSCSSTDVTPLTIEGCIQEHGIERATEVDDQQMTAFHILCANPHVTGDCIRAYLTLVPGAATNEQDGTDTGMTGLHILCSLSRQDASTLECIRAYLQLAPPEAAAVNEQDSDGMTPFQHLCKSDVTFLDDRNFSSLMIWWYHCMPPQTETGKKRKRGWLVWWEKSSLNGMLSMASESQSHPHRKEHEFS